MPSENRLRVWESMGEYRNILSPDGKGWAILEVGIDGDEKPSGNYGYFGAGNYWSTMDNIPELNPDFVDDVTKIHMKENLWDLVICSQVLEHVFEFKQAISEIHRITREKGYAIIDCPFEHPYHGLPAYDDYWRISDTAMRKLLEEVGFEPIICKRNGCLTTSLSRKR